MRERLKFILILCAGVLLFNLISCKQKKPVEETTGVQDTVATLPVLKYGIPVDSFILETGTIEPNEYLSQILNTRGVGMGAIDKIAKKSKAVFDVRKIKSGNNYHFFYEKDSAKTARYFVYENSAVEYTVYELFDTLAIYKAEKEIETRLRNVQGVVESSIWNALADKGEDPLLSLKMSDIFAWTIDFFALQKGDRFRIIYDERFVDSTSVGIGEIYAVQFDHYGKENFAILFNQNDTIGYFDENGKSLQKEFLKAPLQFSRISSRFSHSRMHPVLRIRRPHRGVDYAAPRGTPVMSIGDGTVVARAYQRGGGGNYIKVRHNSVYTTTYMHLSGFAKGIVVGSRVRQGQVIGYVGSTGLSTGPHLDFRVAKNGSLVDPLTIESEPKEDVKEMYMEEYIALKDSMIGELKKIEWEENLEVLAKN